MDPLAGRYIISTQVFDNKILQEITSEFQDVRQTLMRQIMDTAEAQIRQQLIALGWTPPPLTSPPRARRAKA